MKLIGISLRRPSFDELTGAAVMATGLWLLTVGILRAVQFDVGRADAGGLLLVVLWGCVSARIGIRIGDGHRHLLANLLVSAGLLAVYQALMTIAGQA